MKAPINLAESISDGLHHWLSHYLCHIYAIFCHVVLGVCYNGGFINFARISFMLIANPS